jgi:hypothetical protein
MRSVEGISAVHGGEEVNGKDPCQVLAPSGFQLTSGRSSSNP